MKQKILCLLLLVSLLLSGCALMDSREISVTPHEMTVQQQRPDVITAENYLDLMKALAAMISSGTGEEVIQISDYNPDAVDSGMEIAIHYAMENNPVGAYAVQDIRYEIGTNAGEPALAITITYKRSRPQIQRIRSIENISAAEEAILSALQSYDPSVVLLVSNYAPLDLIGLVEEYALTHPEIVMEMPELTMDVYGTGTQRVVDISFTYQNSREDLRKMREQVAPVYDAAALYVSGDAAARQKYSQLYGFLMERFYYTIETSLTPAYSLLCHGVGDSRAFATVYASMCRSAGLECMVVTGSYEGEARTWNLIRIGTRYFHLDLMRCRLLGRYRQMTDEEMQGYVWDYSAYPEAVGYFPREEEDPQVPSTEPTEETTEPTVPEETESPTQPADPTDPPPETEPPIIWPWWPWFPEEPEETEPSQSTEPEETTEPTTQPTEPTAPTQPSTPPPTSEPTEATDPTDPAETQAETIPEASAPAQDAPSISL